MTSNHPQALPRRRGAAPRPSSVSCPSVPSGKRLVPAWACGRAHTCGPTPPTRPRRASPGCGGEGTGGCRHTRHSLLHCGLFFADPTPRSHPGPRSRHRPHSIPFGVSQALAKLACLRKRQHDRLREDVGQNKEPHQRSSTRQRRARRPPGGGCCGLSGRPTVSVRALFLAAPPTVAARGLTSWDPSTPHRLPGGGSPRALPPPPRTHLANIIFNDGNILSTG